jgi:hypothetical protein
VNKDRVALVEAASIARHGFAREWPIEDIRDEIIERLLLSPQQAEEVALAILREQQEQDIKQTHAAIAYDVIRHWYYE